MNPLPGAQERVAARNRAARTESAWKDLKGLAWRVAARDKVQAGVGMTALALGFIFSGDTHS